MAMVDTTMDYFTSKRRRVSVDSVDEDDLELYFASYVPLSNLPTPPLSSSSSPITTTELSNGVPGVTLPSQQLSRLVPQKASRHRPAPALIATYLARAQLPESTVALAACVLDTLSSRFVRAWQRECERVKTCHQSNWSICSSITKSELIVLAALAVASSFLDDVRGEPKWWANFVANGEVEVREVDATVRCIFKDLDYDLCSFTAEEVEGMRLELYGPVNAAARQFAKQHMLARLDVDFSGRDLGIITPEKTPLEVDWET